MRTKNAITLIATLALFACSDDSNPTPKYEAPDMDDVAREYLFLELSMGNIDSGHVDAYFGPPEIKTQADEAELDLDQISKRAAVMDDVLRNVPKSYGIEARIDGLRARLLALQTRIAVNKGEFKPFDEETLLVFGTTAPIFGAEHFETILEQVDALLPGDEALGARVEAFEAQFVVPVDRLAAVFEEAIAECRKRTLERIDLVAGESFTVEYVSDKPWTAYNWYQGNSVSIIQVNTDLPLQISRAVDLGCHEGYPGHHTFNALLEENIVNGKGWLEYTLYPLFSPESVIAEGSGNYGIELAFPGDERVGYEKEVLFPLAGLETSDADRYYELVSLKSQLSFAGNEAARGYLNGDMSREQAVDWLMKYALSSKARAEQRIRFFDAYRSYVINYNHGKTLVEDYIERGGASIDERWQRFEAILSSPMLPAEMER